jgi:hypothetical protein
MELDLILIGLVIALEPIPLTAYLLVLSSAGGLRKGTGFVVGWLLSLIGIVVVTLLITGGKPPKSNTAPAQAALAVKIVIGAGLLWYAWHLRKRPKRPPSPPSWAGRIDRMGFGGAMVLGFLTQPWALIGAGAATVTEANLSDAATWFWLVAFCLVSTSSYLIVQVQVMRSPETAEARLKGWSTWISENRDQVLTIACAALGFWLVVHSAILLA